MWGMGFKTFAFNISGCCNLNSYTMILFLVSPNKIPYFFSSSESENGTEEKKARKSSFGVQHILPSDADFFEDQKKVASSR